MRRASPDARPGHDDPTPRADTASVAVSARRPSRRHRRTRASPAVGLAVGLLLVTLLDHHHRPVLALPVVASAAEDPETATDDSDRSSTCPLDCGRHGRCACGSVASPGDGACADPWCDCEGDWMGHRCESNVRSAWRYLPDMDTAAQASALRRQWNPEAFDALVGNITAVQSTRGMCTQERHSVVRHMVGSNGLGAGYASTVRYMGIFPQEAATAQVPFIYGGRWNYAMNRHCKRRKAFGRFDCYFRNWSPGCGPNTRRIQDGYKDPKDKRKSCLQDIIGKNRCQNMRLYEAGPRARARS